MDPITYVRIDFRCPQCGNDNILIITNGKTMIGCPCCYRWHSLKELRQLPTVYFAPLIPGTWQPWEGYVGAVKETVIERISQVDVVITSNFYSDEKDSR